MAADYLFWCYESFPEQSGNYAFGHYPAADESEVDVVKVVLCVHRLIVNPIHVYSASRPASLKNNPIHGNVWCFRSCLQEDEPLRPYSQRYRLSRTIETKQYLTKLRASRIPLDHEPIMKTEIRGARLLWVGSERHYTLPCVGFRWSIKNVSTNSIAGGV